MGVRFVVVHGRFQPFHAEHLAYCRLARARGGSLVVGITNFDPEVVVREATSPGRHLSAANPFRYWERALMVRDALAEDRLPPDRLLVVAFPIHHPERWVHYVPCDPAEALHVVRVFSAWEAEKVRRMRAAGLAVEAIDEPVKRLSGSQVRARIAAGDHWEDLVPTAVRSWIVRLDGVRRIRDLTSAGPRRERSL
jgi:nicotinamide mononucleotide adenylyltransferase